MKGIPDSSTDAPVIRDAQSCLSDRLCDLAVVAFAAWTLCSHAAVLAGASLHTLTLIGLPAALIATTVFARLWRSSSGENLTPAQHALDRPPAFDYSALVRAAGLVVGLAGIVVYIYVGSDTVMWWWTVLLLGCAAAAAQRKAPTLVQATDNHRRERLLWAAALACVVLALAIHRPDWDDGFYVNMAVAAADHPEQALLQQDTLHGIPDLPLHLSVYRIHSYELLNGALSYVTGIPAIYCFHWIAAAIAALFVPLAHAKLFRLLAPAYWLWAVLAVLVVHLAVGDPHRWYGNFSLDRIWHGKAIFLAVLLPLIYAYALRFALRPGLRQWLLLAAAQIAAVGCTSSALWAAPAAAAFAMASVTPLRLSGLRTLAVGTLSSSYVLLVGVLLRESVGDLGQRLAQKAADHQPLNMALNEVLGAPPLRTVALAAVLLAWVFCAGPVARRFCVIVPLAALLVLVNPYTADWVRTNVTGPAFWRSLWSLPIPILLAMIAIAPLQLTNGRLRPWVTRIACLLLLASFVLFVPNYGGLSKRNKNLWVGLPQMKVPYPQYDAAAALNRAVPSRSYVTGPRLVTMWIPTLHDHAYPLIVRHYLGNQRIWLGREEHAARRAMRAFVSGDRTPEMADRFRQGLTRFDVKGVCLNTTYPVAEAHSILEEAGFDKVEVISVYEIWARL